MRLPPHTAPPIVFAFAFSFCSLQAQVSSLVYPRPDGKLDYAGYANQGQTSTGNRMIDFSRAGYGGGGVAIPWVPVAVTLDPIDGDGDDRARIQEAIDTISALPLSPAGFRGTLLLRAGSYNVSRTLRITSSGVVIRGEGQGSDGTVINFTATAQDDLFEFEGSSGWSRVSGSTSVITDVLVPCGISTFHVESTANFEIGDRVIVERTPNQTWIDDLDMGQWGWTPSAYRSWSPRSITAINGNAMTLDAPLVHAIESRYGGGEVYHYRFDAIRQVGIERIRLESAFTSETDEDHGWHAVKFSRVENAWARQVTARYFGHACVFVDERSQFVTVEDCAQLDPKSVIAGGRRYSFLLDDSCYVLVQRCYTSRGRHDYITSSKMGGPSVFVDSLAENTLSDIGPHHRYAEGILFDNIKGGQINVQNRTNSGTGHGWAGSQIVLWNCEADSFICDAPKGAMNFAIGCVGFRAQGSFAPGEPYGFWESRGVPVTPRSLYYKQLEDRLGHHAVKTVTTSEQCQGNLWNALSRWGGEGEAPGLPEFAPLQVDVLVDSSALLGETHPLNAAVRYPLPSNYPASSEWKVLNGPGSVLFGDVRALSTNAIFDQVGTYELQFAIFQDDVSDPDNVISYQGSDTVTVDVRASGAFVFEPARFVPIGTITSDTSALTFDTDSLRVSGGLGGSGQLVETRDSTSVALFAFQDIDLTEEPAVIGSRPLVLVSQSDLRIAANLVVKGGDGTHTTPGEGVAGGGNGEDARVGGQTNGDRFLSSLSGGRGAVGPLNDGGGAGGGGIALVAADTLKIESWVTIDVRGGNGYTSEDQPSSGGGSGGGILLRGDQVVVNGILNAEGGNGSRGGDGGRIAVFYETSLDTEGSVMTAAGGFPQGANGTIHMGLAMTRLANQWLADETGTSNPTPADWLIDYDDDGLSALLEYALGGSTTASDGASLPMIVQDGEGYRFTFNRRQSGIDPSAYIVETSTNLEEDLWEALGPNKLHAAPHSELSGFDRVVVPLPDNTPTRVVRLRLR